MVGGFPANVNMTLGVLFAIATFVSNSILLLFYYGAHGHLGVLVRKPLALVKTSLAVAGLVLSYCYTLEFIATTSHPGYSCEMFTMLQVARFVHPFLYGVGITLQGAFLYRKRFSNRKLSPQWLVSWTCAGLPWLLAVGLVCPLVFSDLDPDLDYCWNHSHWTTGRWMAVYVTALIVPVCSVTVSSCFTFCVRKLRTRRDGTESWCEDERSIIVTPIVRRLTHDSQRSHVIHSCFPYQPLRQNSFPKYNTVNESQQMDVENYQEYYHRIDKCPHFQSQQSCPELYQSLDNDWLDPKQAGKEQHGVEVRRHFAPYPNFDLGSCERASSGIASFPPKELSRLFSSLVYVSIVFTCSVAPYAASSVYFLHNPVSNSETLMDLTAWIMHIYPCAIPIIWLGDVSDSSNIEL